MPLNVCEIFYSLQGESTYVGQPCVFIRLSGCNLDCSWCDTIYARTSSTPMTIDQILEAISKYACRLVEITGGEPLIQDLTPSLARALLEKKHTVLVETNGSRDISLLPRDCVKIVDIKCPSSNEADRFFHENISSLSDTDEVKFVIGSEEDYAYARQIIQSQLHEKKASTIHISPVFNAIEPARIARWMLADHLKARLSIQQHKIIWDPDQRGV